MGITPACLICSLEWRIWCDMFYVIWSMWYGLCDMFMWYVLCDMFYVICSMWYVLCDMFYVICSMWYVLCDMFYVICSMWYVLCDMFYVICSMWYVLCDMFYGVLNVIPSLGWRIRCAVRDIEDKDTCSFLYCNQRFCIIIKTYYYYNLVKTCFIIIIIFQRLNGETAVSRVDAKLYQETF